MVLRALPCTFFGLLQVLVRYGACNWHHGYKPDSGGFLDSPDTVCLGHRNLPIAWTDWRGQHLLYYFIFVVPFDLELLDGIAFSYGTDFCLKSKVRIGMIESFWKKNQCRDWSPVTTTMVSPSYAILLQFSTTRLPLLAGYQLKKRTYNTAIMCTVLFATKSCNEACLLRQGLFTFHFCCAMRKNTSAVKFSDLWFSLAFDKIVKTNFACNNFL